MRIFALVAGLILTFFGGLIFLSWAGTGGDSHHSFRDLILAFAAVTLTTGVLTLAIVFWPVRSRQGDSFKFAKGQGRAFAYVLTGGVIGIAAVLSSGFDQWMSSVIYLNVPLAIWAALDFLTSGKTGEDKE